MKNVKKMLAALLCMLMALGVFAAAANAATVNRKPTKQITAYQMKDGKWELWYTEKYTYKNGRIASNTMTYADGKVNKTLYNGNTMKYYENGKLSYTMKDTFKNNRLVKSVTKYADGRVSTTKYTTDSKGRVVKSVTDDGNEIRTSKYTHNAKGYTTKIVTTSDSSSGVTTFKYNKKGQEIEYNSQHKYQDKDYESTNTYSRKSTYFTSGKQNGHRKTELVKSSWKSTYSSADENSYTLSYTYKLDKNGYIKERCETSTKGSQYKYVYKY